MIEKASYFDNLIPNIKAKSFCTKKPFSLQEVFSNLKLNTHKHFHMNQIHSSIVEEVHENSTEQITADALFTTQKNTTLTVKTADCVPILIYHPLPLIGVIHAGRKGCEEQIVIKTLNKIFSKYKLIDRFSIFIGPHICYSCYEINPITKKRYNLKANVLNQISSSKLKSFNIYESNYCTSCNNNYFYSYRKNNKTTQRLYSGLSI